MKHLGFRVTVDGETDSFELRQAAIECARLAEASGCGVHRVVEVFLVEGPFEVEHDDPAGALPVERLVPIEWAAE